MKKQFLRRKKGATVNDYPDIRSTDTLGRVYTIHPNNAECFFLRMLLHNIKGPKSFNDLKRIDGVLCNNYREACLKLGLLENDQHWEYALAEANFNCSARKIRDLFAIILTTCAPSDPNTLWNNHKDNMSEDILKHAQVIQHDQNLSYSEEIYNQALILLEDSCLQINNKKLDELGLYSPSRHVHINLDADMVREFQYNILELKNFVKENECLLNEEQKYVYEKVINNIYLKKGGIIFLDASGGMFNMNQFDKKIKKL